MRRSLRWVNDSDKRPNIMKSPFWTLCFLIWFLPLAAQAQDGVAWDELPADLQGILGPMQPQWDALPPSRQERLRNGARRWQSLSPEQRGNVQQQFRGWVQRSPEQRESIRNRFNRFQDLPPERQRAVRNRFEQFRNLPADGQQELRRRFEENRSRGQSRTQNPAQQRPGIQRNNPGTPPVPTRPQQQNRATRPATGR